MKKIALICGITGQDGSYLSEHLTNLGYEVHGVIRRSSLPNTSRIDSLFDPESKSFLHYGDLNEGIDSLLYQIQPDEVYNLAAQSHVKVSFDVPVYTGNINAIGVTRILEGIRRGIANGLLSKDIKFYQASSSEMFGITPPPQSETSLFQPVSPYGVAKLYGYWITKSYRDGYKMFASNGILFNHESPRRGVNFVTQKIVKTAVAIHKNKTDKIVLGNLDALRDWGHSKDYVKAMHLILQYEKPDDWVISTGEYHTVREFGEEVFKQLGLNFYDYLVIDDAFKRPNEVPALLGDSTKARTLLGWKPEYNFASLITEMLNKELQENEV